MPRSIGATVFSSLSLSLSSLFPPHTLALSLLSPCYSERCTKIDSLRSLFALYTENDATTSRLFVIDWQSLRSTRGLYHPCFAVQTFAYLNFLSSCLCTETLHKREKSLFTQVFETQLIIFPTEHIETSIDLELYKFRKTISLMIRLHNSYIYITHFLNFSHCSCFCPSWLLAIHGVLIIPQGHIRHSGQRFNFPSGRISHSAIPPFFPPALLPYPIPLVIR